MRKEELEPYFGSKKDILRMFPGCLINRRKRERHVYVDNGAKILLVAHIDTVQTPRLDTVNTGAGFDDRLGVYLGHKLVHDRPDLFDLLLTDYEESGRSTAEYFTPNHDYNVIIQLDREGDDFVDYGLASKELCDALKACGLKEGLGSFTDICFMDHVKTNKFNIGLGTRLGHSSHSMFDIKVFHEQVSRLMEFVELYGSKSWPEPKTLIESYGWHSDSLYRGSTHAYTTMCDHCFAETPIDRLAYNRLTGLYECRDCVSIPEDRAVDVDYIECESCGDPCGLDELVYDQLYNGFLCSTCHYYLHEDEVKSKGGL